MNLKRLLPLLSLLLAAPNAFAAPLAQTTTPTTADVIAAPDGQGEPPSHAHAVSISLARLLTGTFELQHEHKLTPSITLVEIVEGGSSRSKLSTLDTTRLGVGMQARWYAFGDVDRGFAFAADVRYEYRDVKYSDDFNQINGTGHGIGLGLWAGPKLRLSDSFFMEGGLGASWNWAWQRAIWDGTTQSQTTTQLRWLYVLGMGVVF